MTTEKLKAMEDLVKSLDVVFDVVLLMNPFHATKVDYKNLKRSHNHQT